MLLNEIFLNESPLGNTDWFGDFDTPASFTHEKDRNLVRKTARLQRLLYNSPYTIDVYFANIDVELIMNLLTARAEKFRKGGNSIASRSIKNTIRRFKEKPTDIVNSQFWAETQQFLSGESTAEMLQTLYGITVRPTSNITFILGSGANSSDQDRLSAWMIMHRFVHSIEDGSLFEDKRSSEPVYNAFNDFNNHVIQLDIDHVISQATMASARNNNFTVKEEIFTELLTQYFVRGKITLKDDKKTEAELNVLAKNLFDSCRGRIFLGI